ncbi:MAG: transposase [Acidobacteria bacterium]|nr:transposase [Acidobacteriota bacterium]
MPRQARVVAVGVPHHVTQRGNNRQDIFLLDEDRRFYLETLAAFSQRYRLTLLGYCLMTNHVHLIAVPQRPDSLAQALGNTHQLHAQRFNRRYGRSGHAWQNRFFSCPLGPDGLTRQSIVLQEETGAASIGRRERRASCAGDPGRGRCAGGVGPSPSHRLSVTVREVLLT